MARDRELAAQTNNSVGVALSYDFLRSKHWLFRKFSGSVHYDYVMYRFKDFRDATDHNYAAGAEPLYHYNANIFQAYVTAWF
jgi:hypothetical protein